MNRWGIILVLLLMGSTVQAQGFEEIRDLIRRGDFAAALSACQTVLKKQPDQFQVWSLQGIALQATGRNRDSLDSFRRALVIQPNFLPALQGAAQLEYQLQDPDARQTLEKLLRFRPDPTIHAMLGALAFEAKQCRTSLEQYASAGEAANHPLIKWQRGVCYFQVEQWDAAADQFRQLLALKEDSRLRFNLALAEFQSKRFSESIATLLPLRAQADADGLSLLASAYESNKQTPEALEVLREAIGRFPMEERLYADLATICLDHQSLALGVEILEAGAKNLPQSARLQALLGVLLVRSEQREKAEQSFQLAEKLAPEAGYGRVGLAVTLMESGAVDEAIALLREQAGRTDQDPRLHLTLAQALLQKDSSPAEWKEAHTLLTGVLVRQPNLARAHSLLGKLFLRRGDLVSAAQSLERSMQLDPSDRNTVYQLLTVYRKQGKMKEATALQARVQQLLDEERAADVESARFRLVRSPNTRSEH